ncbi:MAG: hypothetical protein AAF430_09895 [Myxococcota bacterium]
MRSSWRWFFVASAVQTVLFFGVLAAYGTEENGLRTLVRSTARSGCLVFLAVYAASSLRRIWPSDATGWLVRNRRPLGVSFAWAHGLHAIAIAMLATLQGDAFESDLVTLVFGGIGYLLLTAMAATSFDGAARKIGPQRWARLHRTGMHWLWTLFAFNWTLLSLQSLGYLPMAIATWAAAAVRFAAWRARRVGRRGSEPRADDPLEAAAS